MKAYNITIQDKDVKVLEPILKRLSVDFTKKTIKEDDDPILLAEAERVKNDKPLGKKATKEIDEYIDAKLKGNA